MVQMTLLGRGAPRVDARLTGVVRHSLGDGAWLDHLPGWLAGHAAVFHHVRQHTRWHTGRRQMYDREVEVPRLMARFPADGDGHPVLASIEAALSERYGHRHWHRSAALYRDGRDSVAFHGDRMGAQRHDTVVAIVSVGEPRRFLIRPAAGGPSRRFHSGWGDLLVMGGTCQATFEHAIPKVARAGPRIALMFRPSRVPEV